MTYTGPSVPATFTLPFLVRHGSNQCFWTAERGGPLFVNDYSLFGLYGNSGAENIVVVTEIVQTVTAPEMFWTNFAETPLTYDPETRTAEGDVLMVNSLGGGGPPVVVQWTNFAADFATTCTSVDATDDTTDGNSILVFIRRYRQTPGSVMTSCDDTEGNDYSQVAYKDETHATLEIWRADNIVGGVNFNVTATFDSADYAEISFMEVESLGVADGAAQYNEGLSGTNIESAPLTTTVADCLVIQMCTTGSGYTFNLPSGYTEIDHDNSFLYMPGGDVFKMAATTISGEVVDWNNSPGQNWSTLSMAFRGAGTPTSEVWHVVAKANVAIPMGPRTIEIPKCSVCGHVVEFVRSCYEGDWALFNDRPDVSVRGRYYFSPASATAYPGFHNLWSRNWQDRNVGTAVRLGDVTDRPEWYNGAAPVRVIPSRLVGARQCVEEGDAYSQRIGLPFVVDGVPVDCFAKFNPPRDPVPFMLDVGSCTNQKFFAYLISLLYADDQEGLSIALATQFGEMPFTWSLQAASGVRPSILTIRSGVTTFVVVDGTRNFQTLALQAGYSLAGPVNFGRFSTLPLWYTTATRILDRVSAIGTQPGDPVVFVGHSYGAAACAVANARLPRGERGQPPRLLTFGCPKPGDRRLVRLLNTPESVFLVNNDDIVTILPFDAATLTTVVPILGAIVLLFWKGWEFPIGPTIMASDGSLVNRVHLGQSTGTLVAICERLIADQTIAPIAGHYVDEYARRLALRCP